MTEWTTADLRAQFALASRSEIAYGIIDKGSGFPEPYLLAVAVPGKLAESDLLPLMFDRSGLQDSSEGARE